MPLDYVITGSTLNSFSAAAREASHSNTGACIHGNATYSCCMQRSQGMHVCHAVCHCAPKPHTHLICKSFMASISLKNSGWRCRQFWCLPVWMLL